MTVIALALPSEPGVVTEPYPVLAGHDPRVTTWVYPINWIKFDTAFGGYGQSPNGNPQVTLQTLHPNA